MITYNIDKNLKNMWVLPIVKYALDNKILSTRSGFTLETEPTYMIVSYIMKNFFAKQLAKNNIPGKILKIKDSYRWVDDAGYLVDSKSELYSKILKAIQIKNSPPYTGYSTKVQNILIELYDLHQQSDAHNLKLDTGLPFKLPFTIQRLDYNNNVLKQIALCTKLFSVYDKINRLLSIKELK